MSHVEKLLFTFLINFYDSMLHLLVVKRCELYGFIATQNTGKQSSGETVDEWMTQLRNWVAPVQRTISFVPTV